MLSCRRATPLLAIALWGCATSGPQIPPGTTVEITGARAPFYKYGPAQAFGADETIPAGTRVTLLQRSMGYSRVMLANGVTGYVSNEDVAPVAPDTPPAPGSVVTHRKLEPLFGSPTKPGKTSKPKRSDVQPTPGDPLFDISDVPLPMKDEPKPPPEKKPE
jgi:hypothetical protein